MIRVFAKNSCLLVSCPLCHANITVSKMGKAGDGEVKQESKCPSCGAKWVATYTVTEDGEASCEFSGKWVKGAGL